MWSVVAIGVSSGFAVKAHVYRRKTSETNLNLSKKINPACTSHTDRVYGVDVL
jgi:hypothetical protein